MDNSYKEFEREYARLQNGCGLVSLALIAVVVGLACVMDACRAKDSRTTKVVAKSEKKSPNITKIQERE